MLPKPEIISLRDCLYAHDAYDGVFFSKISFTKRYAFRLTIYEHESIGISIIANCRNYAVAEHQSESCVIYNRKIVFRYCSEKDQARVFDPLILFKLV